MVNRSLRAVLGEQSRRSSRHAGGFTVTEPRLAECWFRNVTVYDEGAAVSAASVIRRAGVDQSAIQKDRYVLFDGRVPADVANGLRARKWTLYPAVTMRTDRRAFIRRSTRAALTSVRRVDDGPDAIACAVVAYEIAESTARAVVRRDRGNVSWFVVGDGAGLARLRLVVVDGVGWIDELVVGDDARGSGVGSALLDAAVTWAWSQDCSSVELAADARRWPRRWYESRGFTVSGFHTMAVRYA